MKKKLACMLLMGTLALAMAACGNGQDKNTGATTETGVESTEGTAGRRLYLQENTEMSPLHTQQNVRNYEYIKRRTPDPRLRRPCYF